MEEEAKTRAPRSRERGKGRNNKGTTRVLLQISLQPDERERIKAMAEEENTTVSALILRKVLG